MDYSDDSLEPCSDPESPTPSMSITDSGEPSEEDYADSPFPLGTNYTVLTVHYGALLPVGSTVRLYDATLDPYEDGL